MWSRELAVKEYRTEFSRMDKDKEFDSNLFTISWTISVKLLNS